MLKRGFFFAAGLALYFLGAGPLSIDSVWIEKKKNWPGHRRARTSPCFDRGYSRDS